VNAGLVVVGHPVPLAKWLIGLVLVLQVGFFASFPRCRKNDSFALALLTADRWRCHPSGNRWTAVLPLWLYHS